MPATEERIDYSGPMTMDDVQLNRYYSVAQLMLPMECGYKVISEACKRGDLPYSLPKNTRERRIKGSDFLVWFHADRLRPSNGDDST